jgi:hypothetical protein
VDYEYASISYYAQGQRNDLGEPERTLTQRATNVKCAIDLLTRLPSHIRQGSLRDMLRQGISERAVFTMTLSSHVTIEPGDVVTDYDGTTYDVLQAVNCYTHKEAFLRKRD